MRAFTSSPSCRIPTPQLRSWFAARNLPESLTSAVVAAVRAVDSGIPLYDIKTMEQRVDDSLVGRRFVVVLLTSFAALALSAGRARPVRCDQLLGEPAHT